MAMFPMTLGDP